ncbi:acyl-CoA thioesterase [Streptomyces xiangluensis]|uniref:Acyl-CoA thioesterase n=1 Tax=Streptomyces xiangluensis TaxID=2665720 RepID=A0ABV8YLR2_9ACTN
MIRDVELGGMAFFQSSHVVEHVDTDDSGVMHFSRFLSLVETATLRGFHELGCGIAHMRAQKKDLVVSEAHTRYYVPAKFLDRLEVVVHMEHVGAAQLRIAGAVSRDKGDGDRPVLLARTNLVLGLVDADTGRASVIPPRVKAVLAAVPERSVLGDAKDD